MAVPKKARVIAARELSEHTREIELEVIEGAPLGFAGGQYVIVNSGVALPDGRIAKRAYSILSSDRVQDRFELTVRRIGPGPGSNWIHRLRPGDTFEFSGPWGKYLANPDDPPGDVLVVATDTGVTAAIGLVTGQAFAGRLARTRLVWASESPDYFLPLSRIAERLPPELAGWDRATIGPVGAPGRVDAFRDLVRSATSGTLPALVFLSGDGAAIHPAAQNDLVARGLPEASVKIESFFNTPSRKVPAAT